MNELKKDHDDIITFLMKLLKDFDETLKGEWNDSITRYLLDEDLELIERITKKTMKEILEER